MEAKTTKYGKSSLFFVPPNESRFSIENSTRYFLYRVFRFRTGPGMFALRGYLKGNCDLEPSQFMARPAWKETVGDSPGLVLAGA